MDQRDAQCLGFFCENTRSNGVDREGRVRLAFGLIDGSVGCGVDDQVGAMGLDLLADLVDVGQVKLVAAQDDELAQALELQLQFSGDLAVLAGDQDLHGKRSASFRLLPF